MSRYVRNAVKGRSLKRIISGESSCKHPSEGVWGNIGYTSRRL
jgi:hypothetical protein